MRRRSVLAAIACAGIGAVAFEAACSSYDEDTAPAPADGGTSGSLNDRETSAVAPVDAGFDGALDGGGEPAFGHPDERGLYPNCPPTKAPGDLRAVTRTTLGGAPSANEDSDFPFGVVTDATSVYWVSQLAKKSDDDERIAAYNGLGKRGRLHRVPKNVDAPLDWQKTLLVTTDQPVAQGIALEGDYIYWAVTTNTATIQLRRVLRTCAVACVPEDIGPELAAIDITRMRRVVPDLLVLLARDGHVYTFRPSTRTWTTIDLTGQRYGFALADTVLYLSSFTEPSIPKIDLLSGSVVASDSTFPSTASNKGASLLATDCRSLFGFRGDWTLWTRDLGMPEFSLLGDAGASDGYDLVADAQFLYLGSANNQGLHAMAIGTKVVTTVGTGSFWRLAVDETGLFAGEHSLADANAGAMVRFR